MKSELTTLCRCDTLKAPKTPFKIYDRVDLEAKYGADWEAGLSEEITEPVWVTTFHENSTTLKTSRQANGTTMTCSCHNSEKFFQVPNANMNTIKS